jgi:hypothetical protein
MLHELKSWPEHYQLVLNGTKTFEVRSSFDRPFAVGDILRLQEWDPLRLTHGATGRKMDVEVVHLAAGAHGLLPAGTVVLGIRPVFNPDIDLASKRGMTLEEVQAMARANLPALCALVALQSETITKLEDDVLGRRKDLEEVTKSMAETIRQLREEKLVLEGEIDRNEEDRRCADKFAADLRDALKAKQDECNRHVARLKELGAA